MTDLDRVRRWRTTAATWVAKATAILLDASKDPKASRWQRSVVSYEAEALLWKTLFDVEVLVGLIDADSLGNCEALAKKLAKAIRARRLSATLAETTGRTETEAAAFEAKAAELGTRT